MAPSKYAPVTPAAALSPNAITAYGHHRIKHGTITDGIADLMQSDKADLIYSDPPWGAGNVSYWQTINHKMNDAPRQQLDLQDFLHTFMRVYKAYARGPIIIEYSQKWRQQFIDLAASYNLVHSHTSELLYRSGSKLLPCDLMVFGNGAPVSIPQAFPSDVHHTYGYNTLKAVFRHFAAPGSIVLDPCCGMGYTAQAAIDNDMLFRGNELNAKRLQITANRLFRSVS